MKQTRKKEPRVLVYFNMTNQPKIINRCQRGGRQLKRGSEFFGRFQSDSDYSFGVENPRLKSSVNDIKFPKHPYKLTDLGEISKPKYKRM